MRGRRLVERDAIAFFAQLLEVADKRLECRITAVGGQHPTSTWVQRPGVFA